MAPKVSEPGPSCPASAPRRERGGRVTYIKASIFVEKDNHRKIIIGRHGQLIKQIGIEARREIEEILETKVYLDLQSKSGRTGATPPTSWI